MYMEDKLAEAIGVPREELVPFRSEDRTRMDGRQILWTREGVRALLDDLGIPIEKSPASMLDELLEGAAHENVRTGELTVFKVPGNPDTARVILAKDGDVVVRCLIRPGTGRDYQPNLKIHAKEKTVGLWQVDLKKTRFPFRSRRLANA